MKWFGKINKHPNFVTVEQIANALRIPPQEVIEFGMGVGVYLDSKDTVVEPVCARTLYTVIKKHNGKDNK